MTQGLSTFSAQQPVVDYFKGNFARDAASFVSDIDRRCQMYTRGVARPECDPSATVAYLDSVLKALHPPRAFASEEPRALDARCRDLPLVRSTEASLADQVGARANIRATAP